MSLAYAKELIASLEEDVVNPNDCALVRQYMLAHFSSTSIHSTESRNELDESGTLLWNQITRKCRDGEEVAQITKLAPVIRAYAFVLIDDALPKANTAHRERLRNITTRCLRTALKTLRALLNADELDLAALITQRAAKCASVLTECRESSSHKDNRELLGTDLEQFHGELWLLRTTLAWKQNRLDLACLHLSKCTLSYSTSDHVTLAQKYADLAYEIGRAELKHKRFSSAVDWLNRSCQTCDDIEASQLGYDDGELRLCAMHDLGTALLGCGDYEAQQKAENLVNRLEAETGSKLATLLLKLELLAKRSPVSSSDYAATVTKLITSVILTDDTFKTILYHIQKLRDLNVPIAITTIEHFIRIRLFEAGNLAWLEKTLVMRLWLCTVSNQDDMLLSKTLHLLNDLHNASVPVFGADATHAAHTLIWKCIETAYSTDQRPLALQWCRLALHVLFSSVGNTNRHKIARKMMQIALGIGDLTSAREAYDALSDDGRREPLSMYLAYKLGVRTGDDGMTSAALQGLSSSDMSDPDILYACVLEAQQAGSRGQAIDCLSKIVDSLAANTRATARLPILIRCTVRMLMTELQEDGADARLLCQEIVRLLRIAATHEQVYTKATGSDPGDELAELYWIAKTSYNLALSHCESMESQPLIELLESCLVFTQLLRSRVGDEKESTKLSRREATCQFLVATAQVINGRGQDNIESALQAFLQVREHVKEFQTLVDTTLEASTKTDSQDKSLGSMISEMIKYDLESIVRLQAWDDLDTTLGRVTRLAELDHVETLTDLFIVVHEQMLQAQVDARFHSKIPAVIQTVINKSWSEQRHDIGKVAKWLRCMFGMTIDTNQDMAMQCLEQALATAIHRSAGHKPYPQDELEWLAGTAFNHAIDLYCASDLAGYQRWGEAALNMTKATIVDQNFFVQMQNAWLRLSSKDTGD